MSLQLLKVEFFNSYTKKYVFLGDYFYVSSLDKLKNKFNQLKFINQNKVEVISKRDPRQRFTLVKNLKKQSKKIFYRIEHATKKNKNNNIGYGPYVDVFNKKWKSREHWGDRHAAISPKSLFQDIPLVEANVLKKRYLIYGFTSMKKLNDWFYDEREREKLKSLGFVIKQYESISYIIGSHQVGFVPYKLISTIEIS